LSVRPDNRIRRGIYALAALLLLGLFGLRLLEIDRTLLAIFAAASGLLVVLLLITYRAFASVAESARNGTLGPPAKDDKDDQ
jgi:hypothetical protein